MGFFSRLSAMLKRYDPNILGQLGSPFIYTVDALYCRLFYGMHYEQYVGNNIYKKNRRERLKYLSTGKSLKITRKIVNACSPEERAMIGNKYKFNTTFKKYVKRAFIAVHESSEAELRDFMREHPVVLAKETLNTQGKGIRRIEYDPATVDSVVAELKAQRIPLLLEEFITQHPDAAIPNPTSVNTVRIATMLDKNHKGHVVGACFRAGGPGFFVDNLHNGGAAYPIDLDTGIVCGPGRNANDFTLYYYHPSTNTLMLGYQVPNWEILKQAVIESAEMMDKMNWIGWDVAITSEGVEFVEANFGHNPIALQFNDVGIKKLVLGYLK